ncbi:MAG: Disulfide bond reductase DsbH precursor [Planctomycetota bacterium]
MSLSRTMSFAASRQVSEVQGAAGSLGAARACLWAVVALLAGGIQAIAGETWHSSYETALAAATDSGRPVLTVFTGSDWCVHCRHLEENVLHTATFKDWARDRVVLLMIDLPQQGISQQERQQRSQVCIKYGIRTFPSVLLIAPDGSKITAQSGYKGQTAATWVASLDGHVPQPAVHQAEADREERVLSSLDDAVAEAKDVKRPILVMVSRSSDAAAKTAVASLIKDPEFESLARENFVVAAVPAAGEPEAAEQIDELLGGVELPPDSVEIIVTDDGRTPLYAESGTQPPQRVVSGLRRFLASRSRITRSGGESALR